MDYRSPAACLELLKNLHPVNVDETQRLLTEMVLGLLDAQPPANQHLEVLEAARSEIAFAQGELARRYAAHPLPPDSAENETLARVLALWRGMARSYERIAEQDWTEGTLDDQRALLAQRRVHYAGMVLLEYFRAHRALPTGAWAQLHDSFSAADAQGVAHVRVPEPFNDVWQAQSAGEAHAAVLLVELANPFGRSEREFRWVCRWAQRFAPYSGLNGLGDGAKPTAYALDLRADHGLRPSGLLPRSATVRHFDGTHLAGQFRAILAEFKQGVKPAALGLGADCPSDAGAKLLVSLYRPWGLASAGRRFPRRGGRGRAELSGDWLATAFHIDGHVFGQAEAPSNIRSLRSDISLMTFGERAPEADPGGAATDRSRLAEKLGFVCARWDVADQSVGGFRLQQRPHGERLEHHQLVGIRPPDGERFLLGQVSWLMYREDGVMEAGVHLLTGLPEVVAMRPLGRHPNHRSAFQPAFVLPPTPALKAPASLVLPGGWYLPHRVVERQDSKTVQYRLTGLLMRGTDFDQVSFETVATPADGSLESAR